LWLEIDKYPKSLIDFWIKPFQLVFILGLFFRKYKNRIEYKKFVNPQAVRNILTEIENKLAESNE